MQKFNKFLISSKHRLLITSTTLIFLFAHDRFIQAKISLCGFFFIESCSWGEFSVYFREIQWNLYLGDSILHHHNHNHQHHHRFISFSNIKIDPNNLLHMIFNILWHYGVDIVLCSPCVFLKVKKWKICNFWMQNEEFLWVIVFCREEGRCPEIKLCVYFESFQCLFERKHMKHEKWKLQFFHHKNILLKTKKQKAQNKSQNIKS